MLAGNESMLFEIPKILLTANGVAIQRQYAMLMEGVKIESGRGKGFIILAQGRSCERAFSS